MTEKSINETTKHIISPLRFHPSKESFERIVRKFAGYDIKELKMGKKNVSVSFYAEQKQKSPLFGGGKKHLIELKIFVGKKIVVSHKADDKIAESYAERLVKLFKNLYQERE